MWISTSTSVNKVVNYYPTPLSGVQNNTDAQNEYKCSTISVLVLALPRARDQRVATLEKKKTSWLINVLLDGVLFRGIFLLVSCILTRPMGSPKLIKYI